MKKFLVAYLALSVTAAYAATEQSTTVAPTNTQTTKVTTDEVKPDAAKKWGGKVFLSGFVSSDLANKGKSSGEMQYYHYVAPTYKIDEDRSAELRLYMSSNLTRSVVEGNDGGNVGKTDRVRFHDPAMVYTHANAFEIADQAMTQQVRFYLPGHVLSREVGQLQARYYLSTDMEIGNEFVVSGLFNPRLYNRSKSGQSAFRYLLGAELSRKFGVVKPYTALYYDDRNASTQDEVRTYKGYNIASMSTRDGSWTYLGAMFTLNDKMSLNTYAEQFHKFDTEQNYELMNDDQTSYYIEFSAKM